MCRRRGLLLCALPALSTILLASSGETPADPAGASGKEKAVEPGVPALFSWADVDGDGRLDLAAVRGDGTLQLLLNVGEGRFEDVTEGMGLAEVRNAALALWADYDGDGRHDLFVGANAGGSRLFHNEGGSFVDMTDASGLVSAGALQSAQWLDHDGDGRPDLFLITSDGKELHTTLFRGLAGGFFERAELPVLDRPMTGPLGGGTVQVPGQLESPEGAGLPAPDRNRTVVITGRPPVIVSPPGLGGGGSVLPVLSGPSSACIPSVTDQANPSTCLFASSSPTLGRLYPISTNLFVAVGGNVGVGTTSPSARLEVAGTARVTDTLTLAPSGDQALDVSTGSIYKGGTLFIHTKGGGFNTALGQDALASVTTGVRNTAIGYRALFSNTTGRYNTASGYRALALNTTGNFNAASGTGALQANTTGDLNTANGARALYSNTTGYGNTASGNRALYSNTTAHESTAVGNYALRYNTTGIRNTACGAKALHANTTGNSNTATGYGSLFFNTTGYSNTANGYLALRMNTNGVMNTASGREALYFNTTGSRNTVTGARALLFNTTGNRNTAAGYNALRNNTGGSQNVANGYLTLRNNTTGSSNIALGYRAGYYLTTGSSNIVIGNNGVAGDGGTIRMGTAGTQTRAFVAGIRGVTSGVADAIPVLIDSAGQLGTVSSSRRFKKDITDMGDLTDRLLTLRPVVFHYKQEQTLPDGSEAPLEYGLIAEEVAEIFPDLVVYDEEGEPFTVKYHLLSAMLLNELKGLKAADERRFEQLEARLARVESVEAEVAGRKASLGSLVEPR